MNKKCRSPFRRETVSENRLFISDKGFHGTVVNRARTSLHRGSLKITLTVPLKHLIKRKEELDDDMEGLDKEL